jgi:hypothetical protein
MARSARYRDGRLLGIRYLNALSLLYRRVAATFYPYLPCRKAAADSFDAQIFLSLHHSSMQYI